MEKVSRNEPCPCGSGKKYKNCHQNKSDVTTTGSKSLTYVISAVVILFILLAGLGLFLGNEKPASSRPEGPAPEGKVWSEEHQHYH